MKVDILIGLAGSITNNCYIQGFQNIANLVALPMNAIMLAADYFALKYYRVVFTILAT